MDFEQYILKVLSFIDGKLCGIGTGILISNNLAITAEHVVCGEEHQICFETTTVGAKVLKKANAVVLLELENECILDTADIFCKDSILDENSKWSTRGYISTSQIKHSATGVGIIKGVTEEKIWDYYLADIKSGHSQDYSGMSGSPVFCDNRIIGILQIQNINSKGILGLQISSVSMFDDILLQANICKNECHIQLNERLKFYTAAQIQKNIKSRKYIPDIFVEEQDYKEYLRYFADPNLFLKKAIRQAKSYDFREFNLISKSMSMQEIGFEQFNEEYNPQDFYVIFEKFYNYVSLVHKELESLNMQCESDRELPVVEYYRRKKKAGNNSAKYLFSNIKKKLDYVKLRFLLLTKNAGQGKTNFVCDFTANFLLKKDYFVLYYNANDFTDNPWKMITKQIEQIAQMQIDYILKVLRKAWEESQRPMVIVIDGLNENTVIDNFALEIKHLLETCNSYPFIKIIMTTRIEMLSERFSELENGTYLNIYKHINMTYRSHNFKDRIFHGYLKYFKITIRDYTLRDRTYNKLTEDILLLRFFCEVNEGKKQLYLYDVYQYDVFQQYIEKKAEEYQLLAPMHLNYKDMVFQLLDKISEYMVSNMLFFNIPSTIFSPPEQELLFKMLSNEVIFKDEIIIQTSLLKKNSVVISFTFDEFRDFSLTEYILKNYDAAKFLAFWQTVQSNMKTIKEGVTKYIFYLARTISQDDLLPVIKQLPQYHEMYWTYIWGLEDKWISKEDKNLWFEALISSSKYDKQIIRDLMWKYDCDFFQNINITLVFEILDELAKESDKYEKFINKMFENHYETSHSYIDNQPQAAWPYNYLLETLFFYVNEPKWNESHEQLFKLTIYLHDMEYYDTNELWEMLIIRSPKLVIKLLSEMNNYPIEDINGNVKEILNTVTKIKGISDEDMAQLQTLYNENTFCIDSKVDLSSVMNSIFDIWDGNDENY